MKPCPQCGVVGSVSISIRYVANPIGTHLVRGSQMKCTAEAKAVLECAECDLRVYGHLENPVMQGDAFVGGHFVADRARVLAQ